MYDWNPSIRTRLKWGRENSEPDMGGRNQSMQSLELGVILNLPLEISLELSGEERRIRHEGDWFPYVENGAAREDRVRSLRFSIHREDWEVLGFRPELYGVHEEQHSNAQLFDYTRIFVGLNFTHHFLTWVGNLQDRA